MEYYVDGTTTVRSIITWIGYLLFISTLLDQRNNNKSLQVIGGLLFGSQILDSIAFGQERKKKKLAWSSDCWPFPNLFVFF